MNKLSHLIPTVVKEAFINLGELLERGDAKIVAEVKTPHIF